MSRSQQHNSSLLPLTFAYTLIIDWMDVRDSISVMFCESGKDKGAQVVVPDYHLQQCDLHCFFTIFCYHHTLHHCT